MLDAAFGRRSSSRHGCVVLLRGEPGLGKTRLIRECRERFMAWGGARDGRLPLWLEGRAASYASATPYGLYQQLLAGWIGVVARTSPARSCGPPSSGRCTALLASTDLLPATGARHGPVPATARTEQSEIGPGDLRQAAFARAAHGDLAPASRPGGPRSSCWRTCTGPIRPRCGSPADLVALAAGRPLLILATTRPEAGPEVDDLIRDPAVRTVELRPLPDAAARDLARALIGGADPERGGHRRGARHRRRQPAVPGGAAGRAAGDRARSRADPERLAAHRRARDQHPAGARPAGPLPDRPARHRPPRRSSGSPSVLGPEFPATCRVVSRMLAQRRRPASGLGELRGQRHPADGWPGAREEAYRFRHALIQEAAYYGMLRADRRRLHGPRRDGTRGGPRGLPG